MAFIRTAAFRPSILDRYLFSQFFGPFLIAVGGCVIIGIVDLLFTLVDLFINAGVSFSVVVRLLVYKIPAIMVVYFPMAVLFAIMLSLIRMAKDSEITVFRASGINVIRIVASLVIIGFLTTGLSYFINDTVVPWANNVSDTLIRRSIERKPPPTVASDVFFREDGDRFFFIKNVDSIQGKMSDILVFERGPYFPRIITAKEARWNLKTWILLDGQIQEFDANGKLDFSATFRSTQIHVDRDIESFYTKEKTPGEMTADELRERIQKLSKSGIDANQLKVEYYMKHSLPFACLVFAIIGMAFSLRFVKSGKDWWGVIIAIILVGLLVGFYFFGLALFKSLAKRGILSPFLGAWISNLIYFFPGVGLIFYECYYR